MVQVATGRGAAGKRGGRTGEAEGRARHQVTVVA